MALVGTAVAGSWLYKVPKRKLTGPGRTMFVVVRPDSASHGKICAYARGDGPNSTRIDHDNSGASVQLTYVLNNSLYVSFGTKAVGKWTRLCAVSRSTTRHEAWTDGVLNASSTSSATLETSAYTYLSLFAWAAYGTAPMGSTGNCAIAQFALWDRDLTAAELTSLGKGAHPLDFPEGLIEFVEPNALGAVGRDADGLTGAYTRAGTIGYTASPKMRAHRPGPKIKRARKLRRRISPGTVTKYRGAKSVGEILNHRVRLNVTSPQSKGLVLWLPNLHDNKVKVAEPRTVIAAASANVVPRADGPFGKSISLPGGSSDYLTFDNASVLTIPAYGGRTVSCWIKLPTGVTDAVILGGRNAASGNPVFDFTVGYTGAAYSGTGTLSFIVRGDNGSGLTQASGATLVNTAKWVHAVARLRRLGDDWYTDLYVNGKSDVVAPGATIGSMTLTPTADYLSIGVDLQNVGMLEFQGLLSDFRIYDRTLTEGEIRALYDPRTRYDLFAVPDHSAVRSVPKMGFFKRSRGARTLSEIL